MGKGGREEGMVVREEEKRREGGWVGEEVVHVAPSPSQCVCEGVMAVALSPLAPDPGYEHTMGFFPRGNSTGEGWRVEG